MHRATPGVSINRRERPALVWTNWNVSFYSSLLHVLRGAPLQRKVHASGFQGSWRSWQTTSGFHTCYGARCWTNTTSKPITAARQRKAETSYFLSCPQTQSSARSLWCVLSLHHCVRTPWLAVHQMQPSSAAVLVRAIRLDGETPMPDAAVFHTCPALLIRRLLTHFLDS